MQLQRIDARLERGNARGELAGVGRHALARLLDADPAALRLVQRKAQILQRPVLLPQPRVVGIVQAEIQHALDEPRAFAQLRAVGRVGCTGERPFHTLDTRPLLALIVGAEGGDVVPGFDRLQPAGEVQVALLQPGQRTRGEQCVHPRQPLGVGTLARRDHVLERIHAVAPAPQQAAHVGEVAVVLETFLKVVSGQHRVQVTRLGRIRQVFQLPEPAVGLVAAALAREHVLEHVTLLDTRDRGIETPVLGVERLHGALVVVGRLGVGVQFAERVRHRKVRFLHRRIEHVTVAQLHPRGERALVVAELGVGPARAEQRLVGIRAVEAHPLECRQRACRLIRLQIGEAERQVAPVLERAHLLGARHQRANAGEERVGVAETAAAHQRHPQVEARVGRPAVGAAPAGQQADGLVVLALVDQDVAEQQLLLRLELRRHAPVDAA